MTTVNKLLVKQYAVCIYVHGTRNFDTIITDYKEPVKEYAAGNYTLEQIDNALVARRITEQEYQDTIAYKSQIV